MQKKAGLHKLGLLSQTWSAYTNSARLRKLGPLKCQAFFVQKKTQGRKKLGVFQKLSFFLQKLGFRDFELLDHLWKIQGIFEKSRDNFLKTQGQITKNSGSKVEKLRVFAISVLHKPPPSAQKKPGLA